MADAALLVNNANERGFTEKRIRPLEIGGDMGTRAVTQEVVELISESKSTGLE
jgi:3-isopropylmalate dehydrogenase